MLETGTHDLKQGVPPKFRRDAVVLFRAAFKGKLVPVMKSENKVRVFLENVIGPSIGISPVDSNANPLDAAGLRCASL